MKMQVNKRIVWATGWLWLAGFAVSAQNESLSTANRCGVVARERVLQQRDPRRAGLLQQLNRQIEQAVTDAARQDPAARLVAGQRPNEEIFRIPVVVHVVHNTASGAVGGANNGNISDAQIASQIVVLNEDYRRAPGTPGFNNSAIGADTGIEFFLATTDPQGNPTTGITRHYYAPKSSFDVNATSTDDRLLAQIAYWRSDRYLNLWVTTLQADYLGIAQYPTATDTLRGLDPVANELTDGVIIDHRVFGRRTGTNNNNTYCCGRTTTHEIGHWLGLIHPDGDIACGDDYVADTPPTERLNQTTSCIALFSTCRAGVRTRNLIEDYMDYSPDACMNLFTAGQKQRMRTVLTLNTRRARVAKAVTTLPESERLTLTVYPNPARTMAIAQVLLKGFQPLTVSVHDLTGRAVLTQSLADSPSTELSLLLSNLTPGIYVVRATTGAETTSQRLLIY
jgi:hypothetical protein